MVLKVVFFLFCFFLIVFIFQLLDHKFNSCLVKKHITTRSKFLTNTKVMFISLKITEKTNELCAPPTLEASSITTL